MHVNIQLPAVNFIFIFLNKVIVIWKTHYTSDRKQQKHITTAYQFETQLCLVCVLEFPWLLKIQRTSVRSVYPPT